MAIMKMRYRSGIKQQDLQDIVKKIKIISKNIFYWVVWLIWRFLVSENSPSCSLSVCHFGKKVAIQLGIWQDVFKLSEKNLPGIFRLLELIYSLMGLLTQPQIVLARLCTVSTHPWGSSPMNYATSIIFKCVYFLKCQLALVKQILHQLHPWIISFISFDQIRTDLPKIVISYDC